MTLKRLMITVGVVSLVVSVLIAWYWQFACTPEGKARNLLTQYRGDTSSLRGWMVDMGIIRRQNFPYAWMCGSPKHYMGAADFLFELGPGALPPTIEALEDRVPEIRIMAAEACGKFRDPRAIEPLVRCLRPSTPDPSRSSSRKSVSANYENDVRQACIRALVAIGSSDPEPVLKALNRPDAQIADDVPDVLRLCENVNPYLIALLGNQSVKVRTSAAQLLGYERDPAAVSALRKLLHNSASGKGAEELTARLAAAGALAKLDDKEGIDSLLTCLKSANPQERSWAASELGDCDAQWALAPLAAAAGDKDAEVRKAVDEALKDITDTEMDALAKSAFRWFQDARLETTGLVADRWANKKPAGGEDKGKKEVICSIASVGYFLSALPEAAEQGWITRDEAVKQARTTLEFCRKNLEGKFGLYYHFVDWRTGKRAWNCEVSILDSAIFFNGCMVAAEAFGGEVAEHANALIDAADWTKFVTKDPRTGKELLSLGWEPQKGLLTALADVRSSEFAMPYFLAVGSRTHAIDPQCWYNTRVAYRDVCGRRVLNGEHPLFTSYYGLGWHGLKGLKDKDGVDFEENAKQAALANREFCRRLGEKRSTFNRANGGWWGISAGDSAKGYVAPGPVGDPGGTVWPTAAMAALPFIPDEIKKDLASWRASKPWKDACGHYGLAPFDLDGKWTGTDLIGIDVGSFLVNYQNHANDAVRRLWAKHPVGASALRKLGYRQPATKPNPQE